MATFNKFFHRPSRVISNDKFLAGFMRQTTLSRAAGPPSRNKVSPLTLKHLFSEPEPESEAEIGKLILQQIEDPSLFGIERGVVSRDSFQRFNIMELSCLVFSSLGLGFAIISYDIGFVEQTSFTKTPINLELVDKGSMHLLLLWLTLLSTLLLYPLVIIRYKMKIRWLQSKRLISHKDTLYTTGNIYSLFMELLVYSLIPTPFYISYGFNTYNVEEKVQTVYSYNELFSLLVLLRVLMVFRILLGNSQYYTNSAHRICQLTGCKNGYLFVIRCLMKSNPLQVLSTALLLSILTFAYAVKVCERPLIYALSQKQLALPASQRVYPIPNDVSDYYNSVWLMMVTMTTVGYGDFFPRTYPGRAITFFACIFGVIVVSLMTLILMNFTDMTNSESRSYHIIEKLALERQRRYHAGFVITNLTRLGFWKGLLIPGKEKQAIKKGMEKVKSHLKLFTGLTRGYGKHQDLTRHMEEEISRHFTFLREDHKLLEEKVNGLCERNLILLDRLGFLQEEGDEVVNQEERSKSINSLRNIKEDKVMYTPLLKRLRYKRKSLHLDDEDG